MSNREVPYVTQPLINRKTYGTLLGAGAFGKVYDLAGDPSTVVKKIENTKPELGIPADAIAEIDTLSRLSHPNLISIKGVSTTPRNDIEIFYPKATRGSLHDRIFNKKDDPKNHYAEHPELFLHTIYQMLQGLNYLHNQGIVHCDIKPANILLTENPKIVPTKTLVQIGDLGGAHFIDDEEKTTSLGTPMYMPWEAFSNTYVGFPRDMYAMGMTIFNMYTCCTENFLEIMLKQQKKSINLFSLVKSHDDIYERGASKKRTTSFTSQAAEDEHLIKLLNGAFEASHVGPVVLPEGALRTDIIRLIAQMIRWDPEARISAHEALQSPLFRDFKPLSAEGAEGAHAQTTLNYVIEKNVLPFATYHLELRSRYLAMLTWFATRQRKSKFEHTHVRTWFLCVTLIDRLMKFWQDKGSIPRKCIEQYVTKEAKPDIGYTLVVTCFRLGMKLLQPKDLPAKWDYASGPGNENAHILDFAAGAEKAAAMYNELEWIALTYLDGNIMPDTYDWHFCSNLQGLRQLFITAWNPHLMWRYLFEKHCPQLNDKQLSRYFLAQGGGYELIESTDNPYEITMHTFLGDPAHYFHLFPLLQKDGEFRDFRDAAYKMAQEIVSESVNDISLPESWNRNANYEISSLYQTADAKTRLTARLALEEESS